MKNISKNDVIVPLDVLPSSCDEYKMNYLKLTHGTGRLMLFAGDQKMEHLNDDFYGQGISKESADPKHLFEIAKEAKIGVFAAQMGLITRYGMDYADVPYLVKINSKTNLVKTNIDDPMSETLFDVHQVAELKKNSKLDILAIGYTVYVGSKYEGAMLQEAAQAIYTAHQYGLIAIIWAYPRGKAVENEKDVHLIAGAAGVVSCLGADFVKVNMPKVNSGNVYLALQEAVKAAGRTKLICAGGSRIDPENFLKQLYNQIHISGASGNATGRNIHQKPLKDAVRLANAIYALTVEDKSLEDALKIYKG